MITAVVEKIKVKKLRPKESGGVIRLAVGKTIVEKISIKDSQFNDYIDLSRALESECIRECGDIV